MPETQKLLADLVVSTLQEDSLRMEFEKVVVDVLASDQVEIELAIFLRCRFVIKCKSSQIA